MTTLPLEPRPFTAADLAANPSLAQVSTVRIEAPTVGRIVHYVATGERPDLGTGEHRAAVVTAVGEGTVTLTVFHPAYEYRVPGVRRDDGGAAGTWHWPERE